MISLFRGKSEENAIRECFEIIDIQQHGCINTTDIIQIFQKFTSLTVANINKIVDQIFTNVNFRKNGTIEYNEFLLANYDWNKLLTQNNLEIVFKTFDLVYYYVI